MKLETYLKRLKYRGITLIAVYEAVGPTDAFGVRKVRTTVLDLHRSPRRDFIAWWNRLNAMREKGRACPHTSTDAMGRVCDACGLDLIALASLGLDGVPSSSHVTVRA